jgi:hypothetical protein
MSWIWGHFVRWLEQAGIWIINQFIASVGSLISTIVSALPNMPTFPLSIPSQIATWWNYGNYWFPFTWFVGLILTLLTLWFGWLVLAIPLRWAKAIRGNE